MSDWSLTQLLAGLHDDIEQRLSTARKAFGHPGAKGDASEAVWLELLERYLPRRYQAAKAHVVDSKGAFSDQIDVLIFDRQYSPFIFHFQDQTVVPAESVYAAFEAKQTINANHVAYAAGKIASVRKLYRTSLPIPYAEGTYPAKKPPHIIGGLVVFESDWNPGLGKPLVDALKAANGDEQLDMGCIAAQGIFWRNETSDDYVIREKGKPATAFLLELIARLQGSATVPMIDVRAYAQWLDR
jgi:hypothetical protein